MKQNKEKEKTKEYKREKQGDEHMAVSMAVIPMLKGEAATSLLKTLESAKIKPYSDEKMLAAEQKLLEFMKKKENK